MDGPRLDAVVIGGGPAGIATALALLDRGGTVVLLERSGSLGEDGFMDDVLIKGGNNYYGSKLGAGEGDGATNDGLLAEGEKAEALSILRSRVGTSDDSETSDVVDGIRKAVEAYALSDNDGVKRGEARIYLGTTATSLSRSDLPGFGSTSGESRPVYRVLASTTATMNRNDGRWKLRKQRFSRDSRPLAFLSNHVVLATGSALRDRSSESALARNRPDIRMIPSAEATEKEATAFLTEVLSRDGADLAMDVGAGTTGLGEIAMYPTAFVGPSDAGTAVVVPRGLREAGGILLSIPAR